jgi:hypothetical protein
MPRLLWRKTQGHSIPVPQCESRLGAEEKPWTFRRIIRRWFRRGRGLNQFRRIVLYVPSSLVHLPGGHLIGIEWSQKIDWKPVRRSCQPTVIVLLRNDDGHSVMHRFDKFVRVRCDDRKRQHVEVCPSILPLLPETGESIRLTVLHSDCEGLFVIGVQFLPFVEGSAGTRQRRYLNASRNAGAVVIVSAFALIVRSPIRGSFARHESPPHKNNLTFASIPIQSDNRLEGQRSYIPGRPKVRQHGTVNRQVLSDFLFVRLPDVTTAHRVITTQIRESST